MRSYEEIDDDMRPGHTFSSMGDYENWAARWCARCVHEDSCPIVDAALINTGLRPVEWKKTAVVEFAPFVCTEFEETK